MTEKAYRLGLIVGRFQCLHAGHMLMIDKALAVCERVAIFIGSAQEYGTEKNPLGYEQRRDMILAVYPSGVEVYPLPDIGAGNNNRWGAYVLNQVRRSCGELPDIMISGQESRRISWFTDIEGVAVANLYIPKTVDISSTAMREYLRAGDEENWRKYTDPRLHGMYGMLREAVLAAQGNAHSASI